MKVKIGFDVGGTNIKAGLFDENMNLLSKKISAFKKSEYGEIVSVICQTATELLSEKNLKNSDAASLGIAVAGTVNDAAGTIVKAVNLNLRNFSIKKEIQGYFPSTQIFLINDADAAALAEFKFGALKGCHNALLLTIGTGIGGGMILGDKLWIGGLSHGFEAGHMVINPNGPLCACGNRGCVDTLCSATWLAHKSGVDAKALIDSAKAGDPTATEIFREYIENLSSAIASFTALFDPEIIALGGGISLAGDFLFEAVRKEVRRKSFFEYDYKIVPAQLGNDAGTIGAAIL